MGPPQYIERFWRSDGKAEVKLKMKDKDDEDYSITCYLSACYIRELERRRSSASDLGSSSNEQESDNKDNSTHMQISMQKPPGISEDVWKGWIDYWNAWKDVYINLSWIHKHRHLCKPDFVSWYDSYVSDYPWIVDYITMDLWKEGEGVGEKEGESGEKEGGEEEESKREGGEEKESEKEKNGEGEEERNGEKEREKESSEEGGEEKESKRCEEKEGEEDSKREGGSGKKAGETESKREGENGEKVPPSPENGEKIPLSNENLERNLKIDENNEENFKIDEENSQVEKNSDEKDEENFKIDENNSQEEKDSDENDEKTENKSEMDSLFEVHSEQRYFVHLRTFLIESGIEYTPEIETYFITNSGLHFESNFEREEAFDFERNNGSDNFESNFERDGNDFEMSSNNFERSSNNLEKDSNNFEKESNGSNSFERGSNNFEKDSNFERGTDNFEKASTDNFEKGNNNFETDSVDFRNDEKKFAAECLKFAETNDENSERVLKCAKNHLKFARQNALKLSRDDTLNIAQDSNITEEDSSIARDALNIAQEYSKIAKESLNIASDHLKSKNIAKEDSNVASDGSDIAGKDSNIGRDGSNIVMEDSNIGGKDSNIARDSSNVSRDGSNIAEDSNIAERLNFATQSGLSFTSDDLNFAREIDGSDIWLESESVANFSTETQMDENSIRDFDINWDSEGGEREEEREEKRGEKREREEKEGRERENPGSENEWEKSESFLYFGSGEKDDKEEERERREEKREKEGERGRENPGSENEWEKSESFLYFGSEENDDKEEEREGEGGRAKRERGENEIYFKESESLANFSTISQFDENSVCNLEEEEEEEEGGEGRAKRESEERRGGRAKRERVESENESVANFSITSQVDDDSFRDEKNCVQDFDLFFEYNKEDDGMISDDIMDVPLKENSDGENMTETPIKQNKNVTEIPLEQNSNTTVIPVKQNSNATEIPVKQNSNATEIPVKENTNATEIPIKQNTNAENMNSEMQEDLSNDKIIPNNKNSENCNSETGTIEKSKPKRKKNAKKSKKFEQGIGWALNLVNNKNRNGSEVMENGLLNDKINNGSLREDEKLSENASISTESEDSQCKTEDRLTGSITTEDRGAGSIVTEDRLKNEDRGVKSEDKGRKNEDSQCKSEDRGIGSIVTEDRGADSITTEDRVKNEDRGAGSIGTEDRGCNNKDSRVINEDRGEKNKDRRGKNKNKGVKNEDRRAKNEDRVPGSVATEDIGCLNEDTSHWIISGIFKGGYWRIFKQRILEHHCNILASIFLGGMDLMAPTVQWPFLSNTTSSPVYTKTQNTPCKDRQDSDDNRRKRKRDWKDEENEENDDNEEIIVDNEERIEDMFLNWLRSNWVTNKLPKELLLNGSDVILSDVLQGEDDRPSERAYYEVKTQEETSDHSLQLLFYQEEYGYGDERSVWRELISGLRNVKYSDQQLDIPTDLPYELRKYWAQRYRYFIKFDSGIKLDHESWFSVTPEMLAVHQASRCQCDVVIDAFCGSGGNAIQLAYICNYVIAIDKDPHKIALAKHNAEIYGVNDRIQFIIGDFFQLAPTLKADVVLLSPPWGGIDYLNNPVYDVMSLGGNMNCNELINTVRHYITPNIALYLPRNSNVFQILELVERGGSVDIETNYMGGKKKTITVYFGSLVTDKY